MKECTPIYRKAPKEHHPCKQKVCIGDVITWGSKAVNYRIVKIVNEVYLVSAAKGKTNTSFKPIPYKDNHLTHNELLELTSCTHLPDIMDNLVVVSDD